MRTRRREFMRLAVAVGSGSIVATASYLAFVGVVGGFDYSHMTAVFVVRVLLMYLLPVTLLAALVCALVYRNVLKPFGDSECRCRKCSYILKGISKPECPECGESI